MLIFYIEMILSVQKYLLQIFFYNFLYLFIFIFKEKITPLIFSFRVNINTQMFCASKASLRIIQHFIYKLVKLYFQKIR